MSIVSSSYIYSNPGFVAYFYTCLFFVGASVGSFLNVVIYRLPVMMERAWRRECAEISGPDHNDNTPAMNLATPGSSCPACGHRIRWFENIPILSWMFLRGRCSACHTKISLRYPAIEILGGLVTMLVLWRFGLSWQFAAACLFMWASIALAGIDIDTQLLPDTITLPLLWTGLLANAFGLFVDLHAAVFGAMAGYLSLWLVNVLFRRATGKDGLGGGDFKLLAAIGAWVGLYMLPLAIFISSVVGSLIGAFLFISQRKNMIPFGPYLAIAGVVALLFGPQIMHWYLSIH